MKGILLAGGSGSRLAPLTKHTSKQLLPVYDKPLIYYSLATLMLAGIREICVITTPRDLGPTRDLLGDGSQWGVALFFATQDQPRGIADALRIAEPALGQSRVCLILGDNILHGARLGVSLADLSRDEDCVIFGYEVADPTSYGVVELDDDGTPIGLEEKPVAPRSRLAVPGFYFYPEDVYRVAAAVRPSARGELEITDVNATYLRQGRLKVVELPRGTAWMDCGTIEDLYEASTYVQVLTRRQGMRIACPEEIAWRNGWISDVELARLAEPLRASGYGEYLLGLLGR
jgi:glucose-1-phosphate thymidylyltransferase